MSSIMAALLALSVLASGVTHIFCFPSPQRVLSQDRQDSVGEHFNITAVLLHSFLVDQMVQNLPAMWETWVRSLGQEDPLEKGMATHSSILAWRIPWTEEPGGLQSMGSQRVRHDWATNTYPLVAQTVKNLPAMPETRVQSLGQESSSEKGMATHSNILARRTLWIDKPGELQSTGSQRVGHYWVTLREYLYL